VTWRGACHVDTTRRDRAAGAAPGHGDRDAVASLGATVGRELLALGREKGDAIGRDNHLRYLRAGLRGTGNTRARLLARGGGRGREQESGASQPRQALG